MLIPPDRVITKHGLTRVSRKLDPGNGYALETCAALTSDSFGKEVAHFFPNDSIILWTSSVENDEASLSGLWKAALKETAIS